MGVLASPITLPLAALSRDAVWQNESAASSTAFSCIHRGSCTEGTQEIGRRRWKTQPGPAEIITVTVTPAPHGVAALVQNGAHRRADNQDSHVRWQLESLSRSLSCSL